MDKETLKYVLSESSRCEVPRLTPRAIQLPLNLQKIVSLIGIRRSGKTYLLYEVIQRLMAQGVDRRQVLYLNFEDDRLSPILPNELDLILRAHEELYPELSDRKKYLMLDEVQNVPGWEAYVRRLHDTEDVHLFVTGSSSHMLTRELATALRGRSISYEVFPLSFPEYLAFRGIEHESYSRASESRMVAALDDYLRTGGLPEVVLAEESLRRRILKEYVDLVFYKDLVERYAVGNPQLLRLLLRHCLGHPASLFNAHKLYQDFKSQGLGVSKDTLYNYVRYLEESFVVFLLPVAERSLRKQSVNPKKMHAIDWSLAYPFVAEPTLDIGKKLETAVFLHWRRQREDLSYALGEQEIDLVVNRDQPESLINVSLSVSSGETWDREIAALDWGAKRFPKAQRTLVAHECGTRKAPRDIQLISAWKYLMSPASRG